MTRLGSRARGKRRRIYPRPASDETAIVPDEKTTVPDDNATAPDDNAIAPDETATAPDDSTSVPDGVRTSPDIIALPIKKLRDVDLTPVCPPEEYDEKLGRLQNELFELHNKLYRARRPLIIVYEGWDAAGKGGNIKRLTY